MKRTLLILCGIAAQWATLAAQVSAYPIDTIDGQRVYRYEVEKSIGLYRVSVNFGVTQEDIIRLNPELQERGLHYGETIYIPVVNAPEAPAQAPTKEVQAADNQPVEAESVAPETLPAEAAPATTIAWPLDLAEDSLATDSLRIDTLVTAADSLTLRIALMLPFQAQNTKRDRNMDRFLDFYEGALLAMYELQHSEQPFILDVYDTEKSTARIRQWQEEGRLDSVDAIIGLAYPMQLMQLSDWAKEHQVPILAPFVDHIEGIETNPYLLQFNSSAEQEARAMGAWLEEHKDSINCVLVDAKEADIPPSIRLLRKEITARNIPYTTTSIHHILNDSLSLALRDSVENILIFNTDRYSNIQVLMPRVLQSKGNRQVTLYTKYSWSRENIILPQIYTSIFATDEPADLTEYEELHARYFGATSSSSELPRFDLLGYDLVRELVTWLRQGEDCPGLQSDIRFEKIGEEGGYVNTHINIQHTAP